MSLVIKLRGARTGVVLAVVAAASLCGCRSAPVGELFGGPEPVAVVLDGSLDEWPSGETIVADRDWMYVRVRPGREVTLQAAPATYALMLDLDGDAATGARTTVKGRALGVDLEVLFSPPPEREQPGPKSGVRAVGYSEDGLPGDVRHADIGLEFSPTYAAEEFEVRLWRHAGVRGLAQKKPRVQRPVMALERRPVGGVATPEQGPAGAVVCGASAAPPAPMVDAIPARVSGEFRVVSYNVLFASPMKDAEPFARVLRALGPDAVLVQEWEDTTPEQLESWFNEHVPGARPWRAMMSEGWGVGIVTRFEMDRLGPERLERPSDAPGDLNRNDAAIRFVGAVVKAPQMEVALASVHLKCCGGKDSPQDEARISEARTINEMLRDELSRRGEGELLIAGDMNLVGTREPVEALARGLGPAGGDLGFADARPLGDRAMHTWRDAKSAFTPGRLDWCLVGGAEVARTFVLDSRELSAKGLAGSGLRAGDTDASDHLPVVVDLRPSARTR